MWTYRVVCLCATVVGTALFAQDLPSADQIIAQFRGSAESGKPAKQGPTVLLKGACESSNPEESGPFEIWIGSPRVALVLNQGDLRTGFDGKQLWRLQRGQPVLMLPEGPLTEAIAIFDPSRRLEWKKHYPKIAVVRRQELAGRTAYVLETEPGASSTRRFYIDGQTGELIRAEVMPGLSFDMSDYRPVGGWPVPFRIVQTTPQGIVYTFRVANGEALRAIDDSRFAAPRQEAQ